MYSIPKIYLLQDLKRVLLNNPGAANEIKKIGLFGGSFNPAHIGHLEISKYAIDELGMDYAIWLVAEQNPLKPPYEHDLQSRAAFASKLAEHNRILVSIMESEIKSKCTYDTLLFFIQNFPKLDFTWLMGADCLFNFHLWENFDKFTDIVDIAIFNRSNSEDPKKTIAGKELLKKRKHHVVFCNNEQIDISSTSIRAANKC
ncbi:MAG: hypothetical protein V4485_00265 [Pseudomonadota bacterium]